MISIFLKNWRRQEVLTEISFFAFSAPSSLNIYTGSYRALHIRLIYVYRLSYITSKFRDQFSINMTSKALLDYWKIFYCSWLNGLLQNPIFRCLKEKDFVSTINSNERIFFLRNTRVILHIRASLTDNNLEITCQGRQNTREVKTNEKGTKMVKDRKHGNRF